MHSSIVVFIPSSSQKGLYWLLQSVLPPWSLSKHAESANLFPSPSKYSSLLVWIFSWRTYYPFDDSLRINGANLNSLSFLEGDGTLKVQQKLSYKLDYKDQISMNKFQGSMDISDKRMVFLAGVSNGLAVQGDYNFNLG